MTAEREAKLPRVLLNKRVELQLSVLSDQQAKAKKCSAAIRGAKIRISLSPSAFPPSCGSSPLRSSYDGPVPITVVSWNVNSLRARLPLVLRYLDERRPDVLCLQETRLAASKLDDRAFRERGYQVCAGGSRSYAGVATLSRLPFQEVIHGFAADGEHSDRRLLCRTHGCWIDNVYVPTRRAIGKSEFLDQLRADYVARFSAQNDALILCGDFNICFDERDLASLKMITDADQFGQRPEDLALRRALSFGLQDCLRKHHESAKVFSWYPLTPWALKRNYGMRLDYIFASAAPYARCSGAAHDLDVRSWERPSDHIPVVVRFDDRADEE